MSGTVSAPSLPSIVWQVAEREIRVRLRSAAFLISSGILLLVVIASIVIAGFATSNPSTTRLAVVGETSGLPALQNVIRPFADGHHARLIQHDTFTLDADQCITSA